MLVRMEDSCCRMMERDWVVEVKGPRMILKGSRGGNGLGDTRTQLEKESAI
jgi:hypothetical protein